MRAGVVVGEILLVVQALLDAICTFEATALPRPRHISAISSSRSCCSPCWLGGRSGKPKVSRSDYVVVALACAVTVVVVLRLHATWS